jgi:hypothetical protein
MALVDLWAKNFDGGFEAGRDPRSRQAMARRVRGTRLTVLSLLMEKRMGQAGPGKFLDKAYVFMYAKFGGMEDDYHQSHGSQSQAF